MFSEDINTLIRNNCPANIISFDDGHIPITFRNDADSTITATADRAPIINESTTNENEVKRIKCFNSGTSSVHNVEASSPSQDNLKVVGNAGKEALVAKTTTNTTNTVVENDCVGSSSTIIGSANQSNKNHCTSISGTTPTRSSIVINQMKSNCNCFHVVDDAVPSEICDAIYQATSIYSNNTTTKKENCCEENQGNGNVPRPWGTYVTIEEALKRYEELLLLHQTQNSEKVQSTSTSFQMINHSTDYDSHSSSNMTTKQLAIDAVVYMFLMDHNASTTKTTKTTFSLKDDIKKGRIHGIGVWALPSNRQSEVEYHIDYAELVRYETNVIYPPLYGATLHCSKLIGREDSDNFFEEEHSQQNQETDFNSNTVDPSKKHDVDTNEKMHVMKGGSLVVYREGISHYQRHGYKCRKRPLPTTAKEAATIDTIHENVTRCSANNGIVNDSTSNTQDDATVLIPYRYRRATIFDGDYPHQSTPIVKLPFAKKPISTTTNKHSLNVAHDNLTSTTTPCRVIMGFNVFDPCVGPHVARAPEHSKAFNRKVKLYQSLFASSSSSLAKEQDLATKYDNSRSQGDSTKNLTLQALQENKPLAKLFVLAKRQRAKEEFHSQRILACDFFQKRLESINNESLSCDDEKKIAEHETTFGDRKEDLSMISFQSLIQEAKHYLCCSLKQQSTLIMTDNDLSVCLNLSLKQAKGISLHRVSKQIESINKDGR